LNRLYPTNIEGVVMIARSGIVSFRIFVCVVCACRRKYPPR